jgi:hypothetical protein
MSRFQGVLAVSSIFLLPMAAAHADSYQFAANGGYSNIAFDYATSHLFQIGGTFNLAPIDISRGPYAEAEFINRQPQFGLLGTLGITKIDNFDEDMDHSGYTAFAAFADPNMPLYADLYYDSSTSELGDEKETLTNFELGLGAYLAPMLRGKVYYVSNEWEMSDEDGSFDFDESGIGVNLRWLSELNSQQFIALEGDVSSPYDDTVVYDASIDFYPMAELGFGFNIEHWRYDEGYDDVGNSTAWGLSGHYFFTPQFGLRADLGHDNGVDADMFTAQAELRF